MRACPGSRWAFITGLTSELIAIAALRAAEPSRDARLVEILGRPVMKPQPVGAYVPARRVGNVLYLSTAAARDGHPCRAAEPGSHHLPVGLTHTPLAIASMIRGTMTLSPTLQPVTIGDLTLKNRIVKAPLIRTRLRALGLEAIAPGGGALQSGAY